MTAQVDPHDVLTAGKRLLAALAAEQRLSRLHTTHAYDPIVFEQWLTMRRNVENLTDEYFTANDDYLEQQGPRRISKRRFEFPKFVRAVTR
jgi:hypothetical protein